MLRIILGKILLIVFCLIGLVSCDQNEKLTTSEMVKFFTKHQVKLDKVVQTCEQYSNISRVGIQTEEITLYDENGMTFKLKESIDETSA